MNAKELIPEALTGVADSHLDAWRFRRAMGLLSSTALMWVFISERCVMPGDVASRTAATAMKRLTMPAAGSA
tara:strand:+ start:2165 stop:2380 length:216 start_codon:yes stop_codon:yes gene_type:complete